MRLDLRSASWIREAIPSVRSMAFVIGLTCAISACSRSAGSPLAPSPGGSGARPNVKGVSPAFGSAAGGAIVTIIGTGFMSGMTVAFDDIKVTARQYPASSSTAFYTEAPPHAVGTVDLTVTNPDGQFQRLAAAYSYGVEDAFDMNGVWSGYTDNGTDTWVEFEIRGDTLVNASCGYTATVPFVFSTLPRVQNGGFSLVADDGATLSGKIVSVLEMVGTINFPACNTTPLSWRVSRRKE